MATPKAKDVLALASQLVEAEAHLAQLKARWELLFSGEAKVARDVNLKSAQPPILASGLPAKTLKAVDDRVGKVVSIAEIAEALGEPELRIGKVLYRLAKMKRIDNRGRGKYTSLRDIAAEEEEYLQDQADSQRDELMFDQEQEPTEVGS